MTKQVQSPFLLRSEKSKLFTKKLVLHSASSYVGNKRNSYSHQLDLGNFKKRSRKMRLQSCISLNQGCKKPGDTEKKKKKKNLCRLSLWLFSVWTPPPRSHTVLYLNIYRDDIRFPKSRKETFCCVFFFLRLKNCTRSLKKSQ